MLYLSKEMIKDLKGYEGKVFSDNFSTTCASLCLSVDEKADKVFYQECYSPYGNFTGKNVKGGKRTDELRHPKAGIKTMTLHSFYGAAIGWI